MRLIKNILECHNFSFSDGKGGCEMAKSYGETCDKTIQKCDTSKNLVCNNDTNLCSCPASSTQTKWYEIFFFSY